MPSPWERRSSQTMAEDGHAALGKSGRGRCKERMGVLVVLEGHKTHQICSFMCADKLWVMSHTKSYLQQMLKDLIQEAKKLDLAPIGSKFMVNKHLRFRGEEGAYD